MKKNKYDERESKARSLMDRQHEVREAQRNNCWVPLEEPEPYGWYVVACLRKDIANRNDADTIEEALSLVSRKCWTRDKKTGWRWKGHKCTITGKDNWQEYTPWRGGSFYCDHYRLDYNVWVTLRPEVRRWFTPPAYLDYWGRGWCSCNVPEWFWDIKFERCMATHYLEIDTKLKQEEAYIENHLWYNYYDEQITHWRTYPKRNPYTSHQRAHIKQVLRKMKQYDWDDSVAEFNDKYDNKWDWD